MRVKGVIVLIFIQLVSNSVFCFAQERYRESIFDSVMVETFTYASKNGQNLGLDLYIPAFDSDENRALVLSGGAPACWVRPENSQPSEA